LEETLNGEYAEQLDHTAADLHVSIRKWEQVRLSGVRVGDCSQQTWWYQREGYMSALGETGQRPHDQPATAQWAFGKRLKPRRIIAK
jgi:hypothetical protein